MIKQLLVKKIKKALSETITRFNLNAEDIQNLEIQIIRPKEKKFGDFSTNIAMVLASKSKKSPLEIAKYISSKLEADKENLIKNIDIAGSGFLNFYLDKRYLYEAIEQALKQSENYGKTKIGKGQKIQIEFVSANPVGPMHLGHGRWAAVGDTLARVLAAAGFSVIKEFYINDYGKQMNLFAQSVRARFEQHLNIPSDIPEGGYHGEYIKDIAIKIYSEQSGRLLYLPDEEAAKLFYDTGYHIVLENLKETLKRFGVEFDVWFSESTLHQSKAVEATIEKLKKQKSAYEKDGAIWLNTTRYGDDKDRVLIRADGNPTYFGADVAYHADKLSRGFDKIIDIWGADHHGYVARMKAAVMFLGGKEETLEIIIGQLVNLTKGGQPVRMSKRTGEMITFDELINEVGVDAARYFFISRSVDTPLDLDIEIAKKHSTENPVFYVQYAHARICSILHTAEERGIDLTSHAIKEIDCSLLKTEYEFDLLSQIYRLPEVVERAANERAVHLLTVYATRLAEAFHVFYKNCRIIGVEEDLMRARATLLKATQITLKNTLSLMGVSAPKKM